MGGRWTQSISQCDSLQPMVPGICWKSYYNGERCTTAFLCPSPQRTGVSFNRQLDGEHLEYDPPGLESLVCRCCPPHSLCYFPLMTSECSLSLDGKTCHCFSVSPDTREWQNHSVVLGWQTPWIWVICWLGSYLKWTCEPLTIFLGNIYPRWFINFIFHLKNSIGSARLWSNATILKLPFS